MTPRDVSRRWDASRRRLREWASRHTPKILTGYPFEVLAASVAILMGLPFLLGTAAPASLVALVGTIIFHVWAAMLAIGGVTVAVALRVADRHPAALAAGLQLAGGCFGVYALAVLAVLGLAGWTGLAAYGLLCLLSFVRATHFRRIGDIQQGASNLPGGSP